jgi:hypothetical protein
MDQFWSFFTPTILFFSEWRLVLEIIVCTYGSVLDYRSIFFRITNQLSNFSFEAKSELASCTALLLDQPFLKQTNQLLSFYEREMPFELAWCTSLLATCCFVRGSCGLVCTLLMLYIFLSFNLNH